MGSSPQQAVKWQANNSTFGPSRILFFLGSSDNNNTKSRAKMKKKKKYWNQKQTSIADTNFPTIICFDIHAEYLLLLFSLIFLAVYF